MGALLFLFRRMPYNGLRSVVPACAGVTARGNRIRRPVEGAWLPDCLTLMAAAAAGGCGECCPGNRSPCPGAMPFFGCRAGHAWHAFMAGTVWLTVFPVLCRKQNMLRGCRIAKPRDFCRACAGIAVAVCSLCLCGADAQQLPHHTGRHQSLGVKAGGGF